MFCRVCCTELAGCLPSPEPCWRLLATSRLPAPQLGSAVGKCGGDLAALVLFPPPKSCCSQAWLGSGCGCQTWGLEGANGARDINLELALWDFCSLNSAVFPCSVILVNFLPPQEKNQDLN